MSSDRTDETALPLIEPLRRRFSPRAFADRAVTDEELRVLFEAARWAPSAYNEQPWRFVVARRGEPGFEDVVSGLVPSNRAWAKHAPVLFVAIAKRHLGSGGDNVHAWHDVGLAMGAFAVQAASMGLGLHMMGGIDRPHLRAALGIPEDHDVVAAVALGAPGDPAQLSPELAARERAPRRRRPLDELVFHGRFGAVL